MNCGIASCVNVPIEGKLCKEHQAIADVVMWLKAQVEAEPIADAIEIVDVVRTSSRKVKS